MVENRPSVHFSRLDVTYQVFVPHHGELRIVDAGKSIVAHALGLFRSGAGDDLSAKHQTDSA